MLRNHSTFTALHYPLSVALGGHYNQDGYKLVSEEVPEAVKF